MKVVAALSRATGQLEAAGIVAAGHDARILLAEALQIERMRLSLEADRELDSAEIATFDRFVSRRLSHEPVARIVGRRIFWDRWFKITPEVLDPRPETEILIAEALSGPPPKRLLDLGTGSGVIAVTLLAEWPKAKAVAVDISHGALKVAAANASAHGVADRLQLVESNWFDAVKGQFDLIVSNPPYIAKREMSALAPEVRNHDPALALTPGHDWLIAYRAIIAGFAAHLAPGGRLMVEVGVGQGNGVAALFEAAGLTRLRVLPDLDGRDRVVRGIWP